jgi:hypothetical protein
MDMLQHISYEVSNESMVKAVGTRANKIVILNENDYIKIKPKIWLDKKDGREIHDLQKVQRFDWLANIKDSGWIK